MEKFIIRSQKDKAIMSDQEDDKGTENVATTSGTGGQGRGEGAAMPGAQTLISLENFQEQFRLCMEKYRIPKIGAKRPRRDSGAKQTEDTDDEDHESVHSVGQETVASDQAPDRSGLENELDVLMESGSDSSSSEDENWDDEKEIMQEFLDTSETLGPALPDNDLAVLLNSALRFEPKPDKKEELLKDILRPVNLPNLIMPRVNDRIWKATSDNARQRDIDLVKVLDIYRKGLITLVELYGQLRVTKGGKKFAPKLFKGYRILALASHAFSVFRKKFFTLGLYPQFRQVVADKEVTDKLYGNDDEEMLKGFEKVIAAQGGDQCIGPGDRPPSGKKSGKFGKKHKGGFKTKKSYKKGFHKGPRAQQQQGGGGKPKPQGQGQGSKPKKQRKHQ